MQQLQTDRIDIPSTANTGRDNAAVIIMLQDYYDAERKEEEEREEEEKEKENEKEEEEDEDDDTANQKEEEDQITVGQGVVTVVEVIIHPPPSGIQDTKL